MRCAELGLVDSNGAAPRLHSLARCECPEVRGTVPCPLYPAAGRRSHDILCRRPTARLSTGLLGTSYTHTHTHAHLRV
jgi:hypothetical protein